MPQSLFKGRLITSIIICAQSSKAVNVKIQHFNQDPAVCVCVCVCLCVCVCVCVCVCLCVCDIMEDHIAIKPHFYIVLPRMMTDTITLSELNQ